MPFESDTIGDPALDLGDVIKFTGGHADESKRSAITSINTKINGKQTIKCVGKNPRLANAKTRMIKNIAGLESSINENKLISILMKCFENRPCSRKDIHHQY